MKTLSLASVLVLAGSFAACSDDSGSDKIDAANRSCEISASCTYIVDSADECPTSDEALCDGVCGGIDCCWCEGEAERVLVIDCLDCPDAAPGAPDATPVGIDAGLAAR